MTKDVLVSVKGTQIMEDEDDVVEIITSGSWYEKNGKQYLTYEESIEEGTIPTKNTVKVWPDKIEVTKRGLVESQMTFELGKRTKANYKTPMGLIVLGLTTSVLDICIEENEISLAITYSLEMNGAYVSDCRLELAAREKKKGSLHLA